VAVLERDYLGAVAAHVARVDPSPLFADEVRQALRERLLLGERPKIAEYKGSGPLGAWIRVAALRVALNLKAAAGRRQTPQDELAPARHHGAGPADPETRLIKEAAKRQFEAALREALAALPADERSVLRLHLVQRLSIDKIAALHKVHRATAARWLQSARDSIFEGTRRCLRERLGLTPQELDSMTDLVRSQIEISLQARLGASRR
jgi:RNA polymerase sigma-70 factor (ECF subfamily)